MVEVFANRMEGSNGFEKKEKGTIHHSSGITSSGFIICGELLHKRNSNKDT